MLMKFASLSLAAGILSEKATAATIRSPACEQDDFLVRRYGTQICPSRIRSKYKRVEGGAIETDGLQTFLNPDFSPPVTDYYCTKGEIALTQEQAESICITKCENNPNCGAVCVRTNAAAASRGFKVDYECKMATAEQGPGAYLGIIPEEFLSPNSSIGLVTFVKKSAKPLPPIEDVQCDINGDSDFIGLAVACQFGLAPDGTPCDTLLTPDWFTYMAPAITCLATKGGNIEGCLGCLGGDPDVTIDKICPIDATDNSTIIRNLCSDGCVPDDCDSELSTAMLCVLGTPLGGTTLINGGPSVNPEFTCPPVE